MSDRRIDRKRIGDALLILLVAAAGELIWLIAVLAASALRK